MKLQSSLHPSASHLVFRCVAQLFYAHIERSVFLLPLSFPKNNIHVFMVSHVFYLRGPSMPSYAAQFTPPSRHHYLGLCQGQLIRNVPTLDCSVSLDSKPVFLGDANPGDQCLQLSCPDESAMKTSGSMEQEKRSNLKT